MLEVGHGQLDAGFLLDPAFAGVGIRVDHRLAESLKLFAAAEAGMNLQTRDMAGRVIGGFRFDW